MRTALSGMQSNQPIKKVGHLLKEKDDLLDLLDVIEAGKTKKKQMTFVEDLLPDITYNAEKMSNIDKAVFFTKREGFLTLNEIANRIVEKEPNLNLADIKGNLSAIFAMDAKKDSPRLSRKRNEKNKWTYMAK